VEHTSDENIGVRFPLWILGAPKPIEGPEDLIDRLLYLEAPDGTEKCCLVFTHEKTARDFMKSHSVSPSRYAPRMVKEPEHLDSLLSFYANKESATHVIIGRPDKSFSKAVIISFRFVNIAMRDTD
jgi:hypothetical protein